MISIFLKIESLLSIEISIKNVLGRICREAIYLGNI